MTWPPAGTAEGRGFGGLVDWLDEVPLTKTRSRFWEPLRNAAQAWLLRYDAEADSLAAEQASSRRLTEDLPDAAALVTAVTEILDFIESMTELFIEPLMRLDSQLLAGPLPNFAACGAQRRCLTEAMSKFSEEGAAHVAFLGFGQRSARPWLDAQAEERRLQRAGSEMASLVRGRAELFEAMLLLVLDVREIQREPAAIQTIAASARDMALHLNDLAIPVLATDVRAADKEWRWR
eukprot:CAMPEP_0195152342 /NCGR_PEP_ID=MMETSP0448-20130528/182162_1 /TAXON_ID=66468 /ORGANISM="Heterocapsa triquestra, Strain CCMP 448" /LENGTH=234 /DNA_ID=CAMNT_0040191091 /DNA_START=1 /DNA_END=701 /DNA_ORIENTATION=+